MNQVKSDISAAIVAKRSLKIKHKEMGQITIRPIKIEGDFIIADVVTVDRLGDAPHKNGHLALTDVTLPLF